MIFKSNYIAIVIRTVWYVRETATQEEINGQDGEHGNKAT